MISYDDDDDNDNTSHDKAALYYACAYINYYSRVYKYIYIYPFGKKSLSFIINTSLKIDGQTV